jgi:hypothetical protein
MLTGGSLGICFSEEDPADDLIRVHTWSSHLGVPKNDNDTVRHRPTVCAANVGHGRACQRM